MQRKNRKLTERHNNMEVPVESIPVIALPESIPALQPDAQPEQSIISEIDIPVYEMGVIQLHTLIRSWNGMPGYTKIYEKCAHLLDLYNRAELQRKVVEAMGGDNG